MTCMYSGAASARQRIDCVVCTINEKPLPGPRFLKSIRMTANSSPVSSLSLIFTPEDLVQATMDNASIGVDQINISISGEEITKRLCAEDTTFKPDECVAAIRRPLMKLAIASAHMRALMTW